MKKQFFRLMLCVCFMLLAAVPAFAQVIVNGDFESTDEIVWSMGWLCKDAELDGVSIQDNSSVFPSHRGNRAVVFYARVPIGGCIEKDAWLKQSVTIPQDATSLIYYYRIKQPSFTSGVAKSTFQVKLGEQVIDTFEQSTVTGMTYDSGWQEKTLDISSMNGTFDLLFQLSSTETKLNHEIYFIVDDIQIDTGPSAPVPGDIYNEDGVNLTDAIISLQITAGINPSGAINLNNDVDGNGTIGLENPIYILQDVAGLRTP
ncbi:MAG: choice-of-anchor J domain-containing protein [Desulfobacterales bacterium]